MCFIFYAAAVVALLSVLLLLRATTDGIDSDRIAGTSIKSVLTFSASVKRASGFSAAVLLWAKKATCYCTAAAVPLTADVLPFLLQSFIPDSKRE